MLRCSHNRFFGYFSVQYVSPREVIQRCAQFQSSKISLLLVFNMFQLQRSMAKNTKNMSNKK